MFQRKEYVTGHVMTETSVKILFSLPITAYRFLTPQTEPRSTPSPTAPAPFRQFRLPIQFPNSPLLPLFLPSSNLRSFQTPIMSPSSFSASPLLTSSLRILASHRLRARNARHRRHHPNLTLLYFILAIIIFEEITQVAAGRDYYDILGVSRDADSATIKRAFRKLAIKYHPGMLFIYKLSSPIH